MPGGGWDVLSVERLSTLTAEHIFMVVDPDSEIYLSRVADTPIWRDLPAVKHGHVHRVVSSTWLGGDGVLGCEAIVDDVLSAMVPKGTTRCTSVTPTDMLPTPSSRAAAVLSVAAVTAICLLLVGIAVSLFVGDISIDANTVVQARSFTTTRSSLAACDRPRLAIAAGTGRCARGGSPGRGRGDHAGRHTESAGESGHHGAQSAPASLRCWRWSRGRRPDDRS